MSKLRKTIRKIPVVDGLAKLVYDWRKDKKKQAKINKFIRSGRLPYTKTAPPYYCVGHEPTIRCNLRCKMCYQGQTRALRRSELNTDEIMSIYNGLKGKVKEIKLVGGEPMVRNDIFDLIDFWDKNNIRTILQTNCTLINENNIDTLKKFKNLSDIATSLDGPKEIHDAVRGVPGAFDKLEKAIKLIQKNMPKVPITVFGVLLVEDNLDKLFELVDTAKGLGIGSINILFEQVYSSEEEKSARAIFKNVFGWEQGDYRLNTQIREPVFPKNINSKELKKKLSKARFYGLRKRCFVNFSPFNYYNNLDKYLGEKPNRVFCLKLLSPELRINQKGEVIWCDIIEKPFGNLLEKTPDEIWLSEEYQKFRDYLFKNSLPICHRCCKAAYKKSK